MSKHFQETKAAQTKAIKSKRPSKKEAERKTKYRYKKAREAGIDLGKMCSKVTKCQNLSCYFCRASNQRDFMPEFRSPLKAALRKDPNSWQFLTIVPSSGRTEIGLAPEGDLRKFIAKTARQMSRADPGLSAVCYVDVSLNVDLNGYKYWQWHIHAVVTKLSTEALKRLKITFGGDWCRSPVVVKEIYYVRGLLYYISKPDLFQREDIKDEVTGEKDTRERAMPVVDELPLMATLSQWSVKQRTFRIREPLSKVRGGME